MGPGGTGVKIAEIERSEIDYMTDRMLAIQSRPGNPEGIEIHSFGDAVAFTSKTMPWPAFNTVKGVTDANIEQLEEILDFYRSKESKVQLEIVPSRVGPDFLRRMAELDGVPAATAVLFEKDTLASLTFAATLPEFRRQGLQRRLLEHRVTEAFSRQNKMVVGQCAFLSQSHRNMEQIGMKLGYIRTAWTAL